MSDQKQYSEENSLYSKDREIAPNFFLSFEFLCSKEFQEHKAQIIKAVSDRWERERTQGRKYY